jgi:hypothetical protein
MTESRFEIIESPALPKGRVAFRGLLMRPSTAVKYVEMRPDIRKHAEAGISLTEISKRTGVTRVTARKLTRLMSIPYVQYGGKRRHKHDRSNWRKPITEGIAAGLTQAKIAQGMGVPLVHVCRWCQDNGIDYKALKHQTRIANVETK